MPELQSIALTQIALWYDPTRIQTWPRFLALLPEGAMAPTPTDLGRTFVTGRMTSEKHSAAFNMVRNLPGLERRGDQLQLRGVGLLERSTTGYRLSSRGHELARSYAAAPEGSHWLCLFVDTLLGREPRTRAFIKLLSGDGATLVFEQEAWFDGSYRRARVERTGEPDVFVLDSSAEQRTLREPLKEEAWWCLGDWRTDPILEGATDCRFRGIRSDAFSLHDIGLALRAACEALLLAGLLRVSGGTTRLDTEAAASLLPARATDFGWLASRSTPTDLLILLVELLPDLRSPTGHVVASELRNTLRARGVVDPDREIAAAENEGAASNLRGGLWPVPPRVGSVRGPEKAAHQAANHRRRSTRMTRSDQNPWQREGVSILPERLAEMSPIVGQKSLFEKLSTFRAEIERPTGQDLSGFFMVIGGWGVGKSRVGHEVCLEAVSDEVDWIIDGDPRRVCEPGFPQGTLPLFVRYIQVTAGPLGGKLETDNWIPSVTVEALAHLAGLRTDAAGNKLARNQDRILDRVRTALKPRGWDGILPDLKSALESSDPHRAAHAALEILRQIGIERLWLVIDEIEDITDVQRDGLPSNDREGIDQGLLTVIPRVIKAEEARQELPQVNFLLLCSLAVGDLLRQIRAIERRTGWHELTSNTFSDVSAFFQYLEHHRPRVAEAVATYPEGLKEAAFFAANRNFGWFNVVMHNAHENHRGGAVRTPELLRKFAENATKGGQDSVFDTAALGPTRVERDGDYDAVVRAVYSLLPREVGVPDGIDEATADRFLAKVDHGQSGRPLFTPVLEVVPPAKHRVMAHMVASGFRNTHGAELVLMGEGHVNLELVLSGLEAFSIGLPEDRRSHWLICADETEFTHQLAGLSPYPEQAHQFAPFLHGLLLDRSYRVKNQHGVERTFIAPAFSFLRDFNRLNKTRLDDQGYLRDATRNTRLEEAFQKADRDPTRRARCLLQGLANAWEGDAAPVKMTWLDGELKLPAARWTPSAAPLDLAAHGQATVLYGTGATDADLETALQHLASRRSREGAEPIVVLLQEQPDRASELRARLLRLIPSLAPLVVIHNLVSRTGDDLVRLGLLGEAFEISDLRTSHFHAVVGRSHEHFKQILDTWVTESLEHQGMLLRPLFYGSKVSDADIRLFARGYAAIRAGRSFHELTQPTSDVFESDAERDRFKKVLDKHADPGPKFASAPRETLVEAAGGDFQARVTRPFVTFMQRCGDVPKTQADLERWFLFDVRGEKREELERPREVVRTWVLLLEGVGLLQEQTNKYDRVSRHELENRLAGANAWLDGAFKKAADRIERIYQAAGAHLSGVDAKSAQHKLKDAQKKLTALDLDYLRLGWEELNGETSGDIPLFEQKLRTTLDTVRGVRDDIHWVYDPAELATFRYNVDALHHYETHQSAPGFPLWRRVEVLGGFYDQLDEGRQQLLHKIETVRADVEARVPDITEGPDAGLQAFPTQALTLPLDMYGQELGFDADHPNATVVALGTTLGVSTIGYKLVSGKLVEVLDRLAEVRSDLFDGGKLVDTLNTALDRFVELRNETEDVARILTELTTFLADAPANVTDDLGLARLQSSIETLRGVFFLGDIRQKTDDREAAQHKVSTLLPKLVEDLEGEADTPRQARESIDSARQSLLPSLVAQYQERYGARLNALYRIRRVQGQPVPNWPERLGATWGETVAAFDAVVNAIATEGRALFAGETETTFNVFVGLCELELDGQPIDWNAPENERHAQVLMKKRLLRLELVS